MIDSGSDSSIISENVVKHLDLKIDKKKIYRLNGITSKSKSLETINDIPVTIEDEVDSLTTSDEFSVIPTEYNNDENKLFLFILKPNAVLYRMETLSKRGIQGNLKWKDYYDPLINQFINPSVMFLL